MIWFIADFYSYALRLVIEIDGAIHDFKLNKDDERTKIIEAQGNTVIRFTNDEVMNELEKVLEKIKFKMNELSSNPPPFNNGPGSKGIDKNDYEF